MSTQPKFDWTIATQDADWIALSTCPAAPSIPSRQGRWHSRWRRWALTILLAVLLPVLVEGYREVRRADQAMTRVENEVRAAVSAGSWIDQHDGQIVKATGLARPNPEIAHEVGVEVRRVEVRGDYAMVEVWTTKPELPWLPAPYRKTRFYQETEKGWLPTKPPDVFYEPLATLQAGRFTFVYGPRDAGAVLAASQQVEAMDADIHTELGLPPTAAALTVRLLQVDLPSMDPVNLVRTSLDAILYAPSPALLALPAYISESDALLQLVAGLLVKRGMDEALAGSPLACNWQTVATGLQRWLLWERSELPSQVRYYAESVRPYGRRADISSRLAWFGSYDRACMPGEHLQNAHHEPFTDGLATESAEYMATEFVEYAVFAYGRDHLPILMDEMRRYATWEKLIPAVYDISASEFEQGWQEYLAAQSGGSTAH